MSKRKDDSSDARGSSDPRGSRISSGSMEVDEEGESAAKQTRTSRCHCDYCGKEIHDFKEYWVPWWEEWYLKRSCLECSRKYEAEEAEKKAAEEKATKEKDQNSSMDCDWTESFACLVQRY